MTNTLDGILTGAEPDPANAAPIDLAPVLGGPPPGVAVPGGAMVPGSESLPVGVHPLDQGVPVAPDGTLLEPDKPPTHDAPPSGANTRHKPWSRENEEALPVNQRAAHDWSGNRYTLNSVNPPIQLAGRLRGCVSTVVWVPATSALGVVISPDSGDIQQGAGITLNPGDSIELPTEGPVWGGVIAGNATGGPVQVARFYNPPGGGLGLSAA